MAHYWLYFLDETDRVAAVKSFEFESDKEAIEKAQQLRDGRVIEMWSGPRFIARLSPQQSEPERHQTKMSTPREG